MANVSRVMICVIDKCNECEQIVLLICAGGVANRFENQNPYTDRSRFGSLSRRTTIPIVISEEMLLASALTVGLPLDSKRFYCIWNDVCISKECTDFHKNVCEG